MKKHHAILQAPPSPTLKEISGTGGLPPLQWPPHTSGHRPGPQLQGSMGFFADVEARFMSFGEFQEPLVAVNRSIQGVSELLRTFSLPASVGRRGLSCAGAYGDLQGPQQRLPTEDCVKLVLGKASSSRGRTVSKRSLKDVKGKLMKTNRKSNM